MKAIRWSDDDRYFGPFTYSRDRRGYRPFTVMLGSGHDEYPGARLRLSGFGHTLIIALPQWVLRPHVTKVTPAWDAATIARLGRDYYLDETEREFGFTYSDGHMSFHYGIQTHDSSTTKSKGWFPPWTQWRFVRHSLYDLAGEHFATIPQRERRFTIGDAAWRNQWDVESAIKEACPSTSFEFDDFDGERIVAKTKIEEREWRFGERWCRWLSLLRRAKVRRSLDIQFSAETGKRKGSWKGGTIGHSVDILPGELHEVAFRRYCAEHNMTFVGPAIAKATNND